MRRRFWISFFMILLSSQVFPQPEFNNDEPTVFSDRITSTFTNIYQGVGESVSWLDIPVVGLMLTKRAMHSSDNSKLFTIAPFGFDRPIASDVGMTGRKSPGSMDQNTIPFFIIYGRLAYSFTQNMIDPSSVGKDSYKHIFLLYKSMMYTHTFTEIFKNVVDRPRPDGSDTRSFFSGHTSATFAAATFLYRELDDALDVWNATSNDDLLRTTLKAASFTALYGWAGYVGYSRMRDNKHYLSDVLLGAAAGTLISNILYNVYLDDEEDTFIDGLGVGIINDSPAISLRINL